MVHLLVSLRQLTSSRVREFAQLRRVYFFESYDWLEFERLASDDRNVNSNSWYLSAAQKKMSEFC